MQNLTDKQYIELGRSISTFQLLSMLESSEFSMDEKALFQSVINERARRSEEKSLARWCDEQRKAYKKNKLTKEQIAKLEALPGWKWDSQ